MLERSISAAGIELGVLDRQQGRLAEHKLDRTAPLEFGPGAAPDVEHATARGELKQVDRPLLLGGDERHAGDVVELITKRSGVAGRARGAAGT